jgi:CheY-like chemotaxis protein
MEIKILFLDDDEIRHNMFFKHMHNLCQTVHVKTSIEAIKALQCQKFDIVCLDHDLGDFGNNNAGDGLEVAEFIALHLPEDMAPQGIIIHSFNIPASKRMADVLIESNSPFISRPFGLNMIETTKNLIKSLDIKTE